MNTVTCQKCGFNYEAPMHCVVPANCPRCFPSGTWAVKTVATESSGNFVDDLKQDQKDFPHIAQDIQVAIDHEITKEQKKHCLENVQDFTEKYIPKYEGGQKRHGGDMWTMGAYQALENAEEECLDNWSYLRQIRKCLDEINNIVCTFENPEDALTEINKVMYRQKDDGEKR